MSSLIFEVSCLSDFLHWDTHLLPFTSSFHSGESCLDFSWQWRELTGVLHYISANWTVNELDDFLIPTAYKPPIVIADGFWKVTHFRTNISYFFFSMSIMEAQDRILNIWKAVHHPPIQLKTHSCLYVIYY